MRKSEGLVFASLFLVQMGMLFEAASLDIAYLF